MKVNIPVIGGIGNQMFCYALHLGLQKRNIRSSLLWRDYIHNYIHNGIELMKVFPNIDLESNKYIKFLISLNKYLPDFTRTYLRKAIRFFDLRYKVIKQPTPFSYIDINFNSCPNRSIILRGFWQNCKYFENVSDEVRKRFTFLLPSTGNYTKYVSIIKGCNAVSIHVRRGDYLKKIFSDFNVIEGIEYYNQCIEVITQRVISPIFFVFSDDLEWCKQQFKGEEFFFISGNIGEYDYLDMYLMSICKHNIIANSTFSWWGAWLNNNVDKIVCAPSKWTNSGILSNSFSPSSWCYIDVTV